MENEVEDSDCLNKT